MKSAPKTGRIVEVRWFGRGGREFVFRARWLRLARCWMDWDRPNVTLEKLRGWRPCPELEHLRNFTDEEEATMARIHGPESERLIPFEDFIQR